MTTSKKINCFYKGFVIVESNEENFFSVAYSDIQGVYELESVKKEIDRNLEITGKIIATYRGVPIVRYWQNAEIVTRNGEDMVDNGFYYKITIHPYSGILYQSLNAIKQSIDKLIEDKYDTRKNQFPGYYKKFMAQVTI